MELLGTALLLGCAFGAAARWGRFCLLRGLRQLLGHDRAEPPGSAPALQAFALALAVALLGTQALHYIGAVDVTQAAVVRPRFSIAGTLLGGALFGVGMVMANACGARSLVLLAGGNMRSLVTLVALALGAQISMTGVLAPARQWLQTWGAITWEHSTVLHSAHAAGGSPALSTVVLAGVPALALLAYACTSPALRRSPAQWLSALAIGALVTAGWWITNHIGVDPFEPVQPTSLSFVGPVAESLLYLQLAVGRDLSLGPALVAGTVLGACGTALATRTARWEGFDSPGHLAQSVLGGLLMGFGGVVAAGCSVGQGLSGMSTLAWASVPALLGIVAGGLLALTVRAPVRAR